MSLDGNYMTSLHPGEKVQGEKIEITGKPILKHNKGDLLKDRFWWKGEGIDISQNKDEVVIDCKNTGPNYTPFGSDLPLLNFAKEPVVIKIKARADGIEGTVPLLTVQFDDAEGKQANGKRPEARIGNTKDYHDYYFDCSDIWLQTWPDKKDVNPSIINKLLFFINPGNSGYTGKLHIKEIVALPIDSLKANPEFKISAGEEGGVVTRFESKDLGAWWAGTNYTLSWEADSSLKVVCADAGPGYAAFGVKLPVTMNMKMAYKIRVKARYEGTGYPELRLDTKDFNGYLSNGSPASVWLEPTENREFRDYLYIYKDNMFQAYPVRRELDPERITDLLFFVNPGKQGWSGTIYLDEIEVIYTGIGGRNSER